jgi:hypothetical protein
MREAIRKVEELRQGTPSTCQPYPATEVASPCDHRHESDASPRVAPQGIPSQGKKGDRQNAPPQAQESSVTPCPWPSPTKTHLQRLALKHSRRSSSSTGLGAPAWSTPATTARRGSRPSFPGRLTACSHNEVARSADKLSAGDVKDGVGVFRGPLGRLDGLGRREEDQFDLAALCLNPHVVHHRQAPVGPGAHYQPPAFPGYLLLGG